MEIKKNYCLIFVVSLNKGDWVNNFEYCYRNIKLVQQLNRGNNFEIKVYVVNGTLSESQLSAIRSLNVSTISLGEESEQTIQEIVHPSLQHGTILNLLIKRYSSCFDYLVFLDPDYYIIQSDWIELCVNKMKHNLDLLGSGYPYWMSNYRNDYPTAYFMIIKSGIISKYLDFSPDIASFDFENVDFRIQLKDKFQHSFIDILISKYIYKKYPNLSSIYSLPKYIKFFIKCRLLFFRRQSKSYVRDTGYKVIQVINKYKFESYTLPSAAPLEFDEEVLYGVQPSYYLFSNPDVRIAKIDPVIHFWKFGIRENRKFQILDRKMEIDSKFYRTVARFFSYPLRNPTIIFWNQRTDNKLNKLLTEDEKRKMSFWFFNESIFSFHLGNSVASTWASDLSKVDSLIKGLNPNLKFEGDE